MRTKSFLLNLTCLALALVVTGCAKLSSKFEGIGRGNGDWLIINGQVVKADDPDMRSIVMVFSQRAVGAVGTICSASIIAPNLILTAAHCIHDDKPMIDVLFGNQFETAEPRKVVSYLVHDNYREIEKILKVEKEERTEEERLRLMYGAHYDLAVLRIEGTIPEGYRPAKLLKDSTLITSGIPVLTAGYGITDLAKKDSSGVLNKIETTIMFTPTNELEFMIDTRQGGTCFGDSGGPVYTKIEGVYNLIGVASRTLDDAKGESCKTTASFTDVSKFTKWISEASKKLLASEPPAEQ